jgi:hypothetical protein
MRLYSVNYMFYFSGCRCQLYCLFEHGTDVVSCYICVRQFSKQQQANNKMVQDHIMLSRAQNILATDSMDEGLETDMA